MAEDSQKPHTTGEGDDALVRRYAFSSDLVTLTDGRPAEAEAIRTVRTHVIARHIDDGRRGLVVCGPTPGVGCSFTAVNLAIALSQVGISTLLIDADLRKPALPEFIRPEVVPGSKPDADRSPIDRVHPEVLPNLSLLYASDLAVDSDDLLGGDPFRKLMERCLRDFEFTIVDTPPASESSDALRVASVIGYALVVARTHVTLIKDVTALAKQLQEDGARVVGSVLNET